MLGHGTPTSPIELGPICSDFSPRSTSGGARSWFRVWDDAAIARLILVNGPPASGKSTLARRYVAGHDRARLVEVDALRMTLPNWEEDEGSRLVARDLAGVAVVESLEGGWDVVIPQYFGRLGYIVLLEDVARRHGATFIEVIIAIDARLAVERFRARREALARRGERHPERDIADADAESFILDAVDRLARLPTVRTDSHVLSVEVDASEDATYRRLLSVLGEEDGLSLDRA